MSVRNLLLSLAVLCLCGSAAAADDEMSASVNLESWGMVTAGGPDEIEMAAEMVYVLNNGVGNPNNNDCTGGGNNGVNISCTVPRFWANDAFRNCCPSTGLCGSSSCVVFGFPNSEKANCPGALGKCDEVKCEYTGSCTEDTPDPRCPNLKNHCYGSLICIKPGGCSDTPFASLIGSVCLEAGNSNVNFKICGSGTASSSSPTPDPSPLPTPSPSLEKFKPDNTSPVESPTECERCAPVDGECSKNTQELQDGRYTLEKDLSQCVDPEAFATALNVFAAEEYGKDPSKVPSYDCARLEDPAGCNTIKCEHYVPDEAVQTVLELPEFGGMAEIPCREE